MPSKSQYRFRLWLLWGPGPGLVCPSAWTLVLHPNPTRSYAESKESVNVMILPTSIQSNSWLRLRLRFLLCGKRSYDSDSDSIGVNEELWWMVQSHCKFLFSQSRLVTSELKRLMPTKITATSGSEWHVCGLEEKDPLAYCCFFTACSTAMAKWCSL